MVVKVDCSGRVDFGVHTFSIVSYIRGYLVLEVIDTSKFRYETGYKTTKKKLN